MAENKDFSKNWVIASFFVFVAVELLLGGVVGKLMCGRFVGHVAAAKFETLLMLSSYFIGGYLVGLLSREVRVLEPAVGAALAVGFTFLISFFTPLVFYAFVWSRVLVGGGIAFILAFLGARAGERWAGRMGNSSSKKYAP
jgi:hypothetical protein